MTAFVWVASVVKMIQERWLWKVYETYNALGCGRKAVGIYMSSKKPTVTGKNKIGSLELWHINDFFKKKMHVEYHLHLKTWLWRQSLLIWMAETQPTEIPLKKNYFLLKVFKGHFFFFFRSPLYHKQPSPYLTLPSPASDRSKAQIHSPTSCKTRFAYFLLISEMRTSSGGIPKLEGWIAMVSWIAQLVSQQFRICGTYWNKQYLHDT